MNSSPSTCSEPPQLDAAQRVVLLPVITSNTQSLSTGRASIEPSQIANRSAGQSTWRGNCDAIATVWLVGSLFCLIMACLMQVGEHRRVYIVGMSAPVPETCFTYTRLGINCPGCGLTRTFIHMAHAQFVDAWQTNPVGILVFLFACLQVPLGFTQVVLRKRTKLIEAWGSWNDWCTAWLVTALLVQWAVQWAVRWVV